MSDLKPLVLGIDTSCDDTSAAVVAGHTILSSVVASQISLHAPYGGVFPTVAKLAHQQNIAPVVALALKRVRLTPADLAAVAVTHGPGLAPALEVGLNFAHDFARRYRLPLILVNHLEGHLLSPLLQPRTQTTSQLKLPEQPFLAIIASGGHTIFAQVTPPRDYQIVGQTLDDAAGECLDKIGRLLNLGYPAAPALEQLAQTGDPTRFPFPLPLTTRRDYNLSFSGLKTYARNLITKLEAESPLDAQTISDLAAAAQTGVFRHLNYKLEKLLRADPKLRTIFIGGGVAANGYWRRSLRQLARRLNLDLHFPYKKNLTGDNAAMIALAGFYHYYPDLPPATKENKPQRQPNLALRAQ